MMRPDRVAILLRVAARLQALSVTKAEATEVGYHPAAGQTDDLSHARRTADTALLAERNAEQSQWSAHRGAGIRKGRRAGINARPNRLEHALKEGPTPPQRKTNLFFPSLQNRC